MPTKSPVLFVSHGAPDALLKAPETLTCWREIAAKIAKPSAILVISAHWEARVATVSLAAAPETIHDFSGFSRELYDLCYPAQGAPDLATQVVERLSAARITVETHPNRGLDHGAWVPLSMLFPQADIPVVQLSLAHNGNATEHYQLGVALSALREEGVLIVASGAITHNFAWLDWHSQNEPLPKAQIFTDWVADRLAAQDLPTLLNYRDAPYGAEAHPTEEHFLPLFVALGAAMGEKPTRYSPPFTYGSLAMDAYLWSGD
jgi:4,5-DOPA dioxygenase extradiol